MKLITTSPYWQLLLTVAVAYFTNEPLVVAFFLLGIGTAMTM